MQVAGFSKRSFTSEYPLWSDDQNKDYDQVKYDALPHPAQPPRIDDHERVAELAGQIGVERAIGKGRLHDLGRNMTLAEARGRLQVGDDHEVMFKRKPALDVSRGGQYFDYVFGRPIKADLSKDLVDPRWYDETAGEGMFQKVVEGIRLRMKAAGEKAGEEDDGLGSVKRA